MDEIPETMKYLSGEKPKQGESTKIEDLVNMAKNKGLKVPKIIKGGG